MTTFGTAAIEAFRAALATDGAAYEVFDAKVPDRPPTEYYAAYANEGIVGGITYGGRQIRGNPSLRLIAVATDSPEVRDMAVRGRDLILGMTIVLPDWRLSRPRNTTFTEPRPDDDVLPRVAVVVTLDFEYRASRR